MRVTRRVRGIEGRSFRRIHGRMTEVANQSWKQKKDIDSNFVGRSKSLAREKERMPKRGY